MLCVRFYIQYYWCLGMKLIRINELIMAGQDWQRWRTLGNALLQGSGRHQGLGRRGPSTTHPGLLCDGGPAAAQPHSSHEGCWVQTSRLMPKAFLFSYLQGIRLESSAGNAGTPSSKSWIRQIKCDWLRQLPAEISVGCRLKPLQKSQLPWRRNMKFAEVSKLLDHHSKSLNLEKT